MKLTHKFLTSFLSLVLVAGLLISPALSTSVEAKGGSNVTISSVLIAGADVVVTTSGSTSSDDGVYHLYAQDPFMAGAQGIEVAQAPAGNGATFTVPLGKNTAASVLSKKFVVVALKGGVPTAVSNSMYILNPEACAGAACNRMDISKKGILASTEAAVMNMNNLRTLGVNQCTLNIPLSHISRGGNAYSYNGKTYSFGSAYLSGYDAFVRKANSQGVQVTLIILVDSNSNINFINPASYAAIGNPTIHYLGLNASNEIGCEYLAAASSFLANHFSNRGFGQVDNYIIGNEVNAFTQWNYMNCGSLDAFTKQYSDAFRIMYNGIKSENATANVYCCTDQQWSRGFDGYAGKSFLTTFNRNIKSEGNIDWRLATHAYNVPLTNPACYAPNKNTPHSQNASYISLQNIDVVTDFLCQKDFLSPTGTVRTVKLSEQGFTSLQGEQIQAAAVTYAYLVALNNSHIDGLILSREKDDAGEIAQGLANGLMGLNNAHKMAFEYYQMAGNPTYVSQASALVGVDLNSMITPR